MRRLCSTSKERITFQHQEMTEFFVLAAFFVRLRDMQEHRPKDSRGETKKAIQKPQTRHCATPCSRSIGCYAVTQKTAKNNGSRRKIGCLLEGCQDQRVPPDATPPLEHKEHDSAAQHLGAADVAIQTAAGIALVAEAASVWIAAAFVKATFGLARHLGASHSTVKAATSVALIAKRSVVGVSAAFIIALLHHGSTDGHIAAAFFDLADFDLSCGAGRSGTSHKATVDGLGFLCHHKKRQKGKRCSNKNFQLFHRSLQSGVWV